MLFFICNFSQFFIPFFYIPVIVNVKIVMDDASTKQGLGEGALKNLEVGDVVQFERVGFAFLILSNSVFI